MGCAIQLVCKIVSHIGRGYAVDRRPAESSGELASGSLFADLEQWPAGLDWQPAHSTGEDERVQNWADGVGQHGVRGYEAALSIGMLSPTKTLATNFGIPHQLESAILCAHKRSDS